MSNIGVQLGRFSDDYEQDAHSAGVIPFEVGTSRSLAGSFRFHQSHHPAVRVGSLLPRLHSKTIALAAMIGLLRFRMIA